MRKIRNRDRKGVAMVELAFMLPILVMMVLGIIEFARAFEVAQQLNVAAREGGRLGLLYGIAQGNQTANQKVIQDVKNFLAASGISGSSLNVNIYEVTPANINSTTPIELDDANKEKYFKVQVNVKFKDVSYATPVFLTNQDLRGEAVFRHE